MEYFKTSENIIDYFIFKDKLISFGLSEEEIKSYIKDLGITIKDLIGGFKTLRSDSIIPYKNYVVNFQENKQIYNSIKECHEYIFINHYNVPEKTPQSIILLKYIIFSKFSYLKNYEVTLYDCEILYLKYENITLYINLKFLFNKDFDNLLLDIKKGFKNQYDCTKEKIITVDEMYEIFERSKLFYLLKCG